MSRALQLSEKFKSAGTDALKASQDASKDPAVDADDENGRLQRAGWSCGVRYVLYAAKAFFVFLDTKLLVQMVSSTRWMSNSSAGISKQLAQANEKDIIKRGTVRKGRVLCLFGDKIRPIKGGTLGVLKDLDTKFPSLHMEFPEGTIKFRGTIVFPKNKYLSLKLGSKDVVCEDVFESVVLFSEVSWTPNEECMDTKLSTPDGDTSLYNRLPKSLVERRVHDVKEDELQSSLEEQISHGSDLEDMPTQQSKSSMGRKRRNPGPQSSQGQSDNVPTRRGRRQSARGVKNNKKPKYTSDRDSDSDEIDLCSSDDE